ncbi:Nif3-like dinuclear metal center hexameric protein [Paeniglutamicibacter gangotriensis]|uniref:GTP cyclohydrolase 1 type 2 homolog n=1 Tax=Paeniglutamicibacter gangotriensis TaxID=254787 RepID=A0A5B0EFA8_9MICC|nr:Nif3-like dinuclear metal center hexameric protein [Paeniglutamicibacter gangotriensis]KAA0976480.1 Nif3-like dinuclear metal center hexameric protein [Paeniglutamicibacter gangotriensis]
MQSNKQQPHGMRIVSGPGAAAHTGAENAGSHDEPLDAAPKATENDRTAAAGPPQSVAPESGNDAQSHPDTDSVLDTEQDPVATTDSDDVEAQEPDSTLSTPTLGQVLVAVEELWPASLAESWDTVGPVVGRPERPIKRIMFAVDPTLEVVADAVARGTDLLITHHPLLLRPVNSVAATSFKGEAIHLLIESGCALVTAHTNADSAIGGVSDVLADIFGLTDTQPLAPSKDGLPEEGIGRVGMLPEPLQLHEFASRVFSAMPAVAGGVRVAGERTGIVRKVAVCGGAGDSLFDAVRASEADVYVTADLRHHPASEAREAALNGTPYLIDVSHFASEWLWLPTGAEALKNVLHDLGHDVEIGVSAINTDPWDFILTP